MQDADTLKELVKQSASLVESTTALLGSNESLRQDIEKENLKRDKRITTNQRSVVAAIIAAVVGLVIGGIGIKMTVDAKRERNERAVTSCKIYNVQQATQAEAEKAEERARQSESSVALTRLLDLLGLTSADLHKIQAEHLKKFNKIVDKAHPQRDCSTKGIKQFFEPTTTTKKSKVATT